MSGTDRGNDLAGSCKYRSRQRKWESGDECCRPECTAAEAVGGPEYEPGENIGARESGYTDRCQGCTFLKTVAGGHSVGADTSVNLEAEESIVSSEEENDEDDRDDGHRREERGRVQKEEEETRQVSSEAEPTDSSLDCLSKREAPSEESRDRT